MSRTSLLRVENLRVLEKHTGRVITGPVSFELVAGECLALVGDSGAGKTLTLRALLGLLPENLFMTADRYDLAGESVLHLNQRAWNDLRGATLALVQQDTGEALDPLRRVQQEVLESAVRHRQSAAKNGSTFAAELLERAGLRHPEGLLRLWPHQLSGGMRQRAVIASALSASPTVLLADEPTTALDATVREKLLTTLTSFKTEGKALLLVTHDMAVVSKIADRVIRLEQGMAVDPQIVSQTAIKAVARRPEQQTGIALRVQNVSAGYGDGKGIHDVSFVLHRGHTLGVLGESGAGKTTLARVLTGVMQPTAGEVSVDNIAWSQLRERNRRPHRWQLQWVPQDALASFARGMTVEQILEEALGARQSETRRGETHRLKKRERSALVDKLLRDVQLDPSLKTRKPRTLSGGQRQRLAIARALATQPNVLVCDEAVSALDAGVRASILDLLRTLAHSRQLATVFISHDVDVIAQVSDELLVMQQGRVVEQGSAHEVLTRPTHPFTRALLTDSGFLP